MDGTGNSQQFTIKDLQKSRVDKERMRQTIYRTIYAKCLSQIKYNNDILNITWCVYRVPPFVYGLPAYNINHCICHLVYWLRHEMYSVEYECPDILKIRWDTPIKKDKVRFRPVDPKTVDTSLTSDDNLGLLLKKEKDVPKGILNKK